MSTSTGWGESVGQDWDAHQKTAAGRAVIGVKVGQVGEVDRRGIVDALQGTGSVEVANGGGCGVGLVLLKSGRAF